jgi:hypothetical protein
MNCCGWVCQQYVPSVSIGFNVFPFVSGGLVGEQVESMSSPDPSHILVVNDDPALRELLAEYLEVSGLQVAAVRHRSGAVKQQRCKYPPRRSRSDTRLPAIE